MTGEHVGEQKSISPAIGERHTGERASISQPVRLGELLRAIKAYRCRPIVRAALQLALMWFQRLRELQGATWAEIALAAALRMIPAERMKRSKYGKENAQPHFVPLPVQAVRILKVLRP